MAGHVFVVHSRMEGVQCDAMVVPTGGDFRVKKCWGPVLNLTDLRDPKHLAADHLRPRHWPAGGFGRASTSAGRGPQKPLWFLNVAVEGVDQLVANLKRVLDDIAAASDLAPGEGRPKPLVALNTVGVGGGGFGRIRGTVIDRMLQTCDSFVNARDLDVVITCASASDYAAFQHQRRHGSGFPSLTTEQCDHGTRLARLAQQGELALFLGAGVSIPAGLPSWWDLLTELGKICDVSPSQLATLQSPLDQAELIRRRLAKVDEASHHGLKHHIANLLDGVRVPSLSHIQLATLGCREVVTTNYDSLYETAANAFITDPDDRIKVLPFEHKKPFARWILKMHGDLDHGGELILSRSDFVGYSAAHGPVGSIVQSLMLTKHLLVVGTSLTDDNFLRLAYEVTNYLRSVPEGQGVQNEPFGTVLALESNLASQELWDGTFHVVGTSGSAGRSVSDRSDQEFAGARKAMQDQHARDLSIMLDFIAMNAAKENYLLDERYRALLGPEELELAELAQSLAARLQHLALAGKRTSGWRELRDQLSRLGAKV